jgi:hypothetical protein
MSARKFPKKYWREGGNEFIQNGACLLRVGHLSTTRSATDPARITKVFDVLQVIKAVEHNPIQVGLCIALSFPKADFNAQSYEWKHGELFQVLLAAEIVGDPAKNIQLDRAGKRWKKSYKE